mgnify:FL=1
MKKKLLSLLLVAAMTVTALTGCAGKDKSSTAGKEGSTDESNTSAGKAEGTNSGEVVTLTFATLGTEAACQAQVLEAVNKKLLADGLNIQIQVKQLDDYWQKLALDIAGGTEYDIAWAHSSTLPDLAAKKVYQPITEALNTVGQELKAKTPEFMLKGATLNGEIYAIPRIVPTTGSNNTFDVRKDLMTKYGMKDITTLEELEAYFQAVQDNEDGVAPYSGGNMSPLMPVFANYHFILGDGIYAMYVDPTDPELTVKSFWESDEFVKICEKRKEWNEKGWLFTDMSAIENPDNGFDYGKVAAVDSNVMRVTERVDSMHKNVPEAEPYTVYLEPDQRWIFNAGDNMLAVPSTSKHVKEAIQFIQWFKCNQENYDLWSYGVEGVNYVKNGEAIDVSTIAPENVYSPMVWMWNDLDRARFSANYPAESIQRLKDWDSQSKTSPLLGFTLDQTNIKAEASQILAIMSEYYGNLGDGSLDIHDVRDEILKKLKAAGIDKVIEETQKQVNAFVGK